MWFYFFGEFSSFFSGPLPRNFEHVIGILSSSPVGCHPYCASWVKGGSVYMSKSQRHKRSGAGRGVSQANGAAIHSKLPGLCQHEIVSDILTKRKQCGALQACYGCLVSHVGMGVRISVVAPYFCGIIVSGLDVCR